MLLKKYLQLNASFVYFSKINLGKTVKSEQQVFEFIVEVQIIPASKGISLALHRMLGDEALFSRIWE